MSTPPSERLPAEPILGRYQVEELLGRGGMGAVYRAHDLGAGRQVAVKFLLGDPGPQRLERFRREGQAAARLDHPGILRVHAAGEEQGRPFLVYELVEGARDLESVAPRLPRRRRVELVRDAARALGHAHAQGLVHRDVKPENLLVDGDGRLRVADFGLAQLQGAERLTRTGTALGTPLYMSPEQLSDSSRVGPPSDVWSLGVVLYVVLCGAAPFDEDRMTALMSRIVEGRVRPPRELAPDLPPALERICLRALTVDTERRYPHGGALADDLDAWLAGAQPAPRRALLWPLLGLGAAVLLGLLGALTTRGQAGAPAPARANALASPAPASLAPASPASPVPAQAPLELAQVYALLPEEELERSQGVWLSATRFLTWSSSGGNGARLWELDPAGKPRPLGQRAFPDLRHVLVDREHGQLVLASARMLSWWREGLLQSGDRLAQVDLELLKPLAISIRDIRLLPGPTPRVVVGGVRPGKQDEARALVLALELPPGASEPRLLQRWDLPGQSAYVVAPAPDGRRILVATGPHSTPNVIEQGALGLLVLGEPAPRWTTVEGEGVADACVGPDGETCAVIRFTGRLELLSLRSGQRQRLQGSGIQEAQGGFELLQGTVAHGGQGRAVIFLDDARLVSASGDAQIPGGNELRVWRLKDGAELFQLLHLPQALCSLDLSPDGRRLLVGVFSGQPELRGTSFAPLAEAR